MRASGAAHNDKDPSASLRDHARKGLEIEVLVRSVAERVAVSSGLDLVDVEMKRGGKGPLLRIFLDKAAPKGPVEPAGPAQRISLDEIESASREISAILDVEDPVGRSYTLEVSSPGMTRPLKTPKDFVRVLHKDVQIAFVEPGTASGPDASKSIASKPDVSGPAGSKPSGSKPSGSKPAGSDPAGSNEVIKEIKGRLLAVTDAEVRILPRDNKGREGAEIAVPFSAVRHAQREISFR